MNQFCALFVIMALIAGGFGQSLEGCNHKVDTSELKVSNPDSYAEITRPCPDFDLDCVRTYLAANSDCTAVSSTVADPLHRDTITTYLFRANVTKTMTDIEINGLNGEVEEFYINEATNNLVFTVKFTNFTLNSATAYIKFHRKAQEPVVTADYFYEQYSTLEITAVAPIVNGKINLGAGDIVAYAPIPYYAYGLGIANTKDPSALADLQVFLADVGANVQEALLTTAPVYFGIFVQTSLCDYGLSTADLLI